MTRSERLDVVQQVTAHTEREHAERVGAAERHVVEMEQKLAALENYRKEYEDGFAARAGAGLGRRRRCAISRHFWRVSARRSTQQREAGGAARAAHQDADRSHWREAAKRAHVVDTLAERWQVEESRDGDPPRSARQRRVVAAAAFQESRGQVMISNVALAIQPMPRSAAPAAGETADTGAFDALLALQSLIDADAAAESPARWKASMRWQASQDEAADDSTDDDDGDRDDALWFLAAPLPALKVPMAPVAGGASVAAQVHNDPLAIPGRLPARFPPPHRATRPKISRRRSRSPAPTRRRATRSRLCLTPRRRQRRSSTRPPGIP